MPNDEDELATHISDDDDDAKLTHNTKAANDMEVPAKLKKPEVKPNVMQKRKGSKASLEPEEPKTVAQRMEQLHAQ